MEIRAINEKIDVEYPIFEEMKGKDLVSNMEQTMPVVSKKDINQMVNEGENRITTDFVGGMSNMTEIEIEENPWQDWIENVSSITGLVGFILSIIFVVVIFIEKIRHNKTNKNEPYKINKVIKVMLILSITIFVLGVIGLFVGLLL